MRPTLSGRNPSAYSLDLGAGHHLADGKGQHAKVTTSQPGRGRKRDKEQETQARGEQRR